MRRKVGGKKEKRRRKVEGKEEKKRKEVEGLLRTTYRRHPRHLNFFPLPSLK